jgi:aspartyl-tRNA(Asn)/glutamyl-tRNA(Gln) amidotransferase subunit A
MHATWQRGIDWLRAAGARIVWVSLPLTKLALPTYYLIAPAEASSNLARYDGLRFGYCFTSNYASLAKMYTDNRTAGFGPEVQRRVLLGSFALSSRAYVFDKTAVFYLNCFTLGDFTFVFSC